MHLTNCWGKLRKAIFMTICKKRLIFNGIFNMLSAEQMSNTNVKNTEKWCGFFSGSVGEHPRSILKHSGQECKFNLKWVNPEGWPFVLFPLSSK